MTKTRREPLAAQVARRIAAARRTRGWTQAALAEALDIAPRNLQRLESGRQNLTLETIEAVAAALEVPPESLCPGPATAVWPELPGGRSPRIVPVVSLEAAAGLVRAPRSVRATGWAVAEGPHDGTLFAARVAGDSMAPLAPAGALALFHAPSGPPARAGAYLWQLREDDAPEDGGSFLLKRFGGRQPLGDGAALVTLLSDNPRRPARVVRVEAPGQLRALARFIRVLD